MTSYRNFFTGLVTLVFALTLHVSAIHAADKPVVGLVMKSLANEFFKTMEEGARKYAEKDGTFTLVPVGMNSETDFDTQIAAMENFITQQVDMIVVAPADSAGMAFPVKKAVDAGITVVIFDVTLDKGAMKKAGLPANIFFEQIPRKRGFVDFKTLYRSTQELLDVVGLDVSPNTVEKFCCTVGL